VKVDRDAFGEEHELFGRALRHFDEREVERDAGRKAMKGGRYARSARDAGSSATVRDDEHYVQNGHHGTDICAGTNEITNVIITKQLDL